MCVEGRRSAYEVAKTSVLSCIYSVKYFCCSGVKCESFNVMLESANERFFLGIVLEGAPDENGVGNHRLSDSARC